MNNNILYIDDLKQITGCKTTSSIIARLEKMEIPFHRVNGVVSTSVQAYNKALGIDPDSKPQRANKPVIKIR